MARREARTIDDARRGLAFGELVIWLGKSSGKLR